MKHFLALPVAMAMIAASAPPVTIVSADGDWNVLPRLGQYGYQHLDPKMMVKLHEIAQQRQCVLPGYVGNRLDFRISFAAQFDPDGTLRQIVIPKLNCPEAEGVIGGALIDMIHGGDYRPTGKGPEGWYRGDFSFAYEG